MEIVRDLVAHKEGLQNPETLEELLEALTRYGHPTISYMERGTWWCRINMFVQAQGATFTVGSESDKYEKLIDAAKECYQRVVQAVSDLQEVTI